MLTVTNPADDLALLTLDELRSAAGVTGSGSDTDLLAMGYRVAASIMTECNIAVGSGAPPTLLREALVETFRLRQSIDRLILSRRHEIAITSIVADGVTLASTDYEVDPESGLVTRLSDDLETCWHCGKVVVTYSAGFTDPPSDLKQAAMKAVASFWAETGKDANLKREEIPGVLLREWWVGDTADSLLPLEVKDALKRFRNMVI